MLFAESKRIRLSLCPSSFHNSSGLPNLSQNQSSDPDSKFQSYHPVADLSALILQGSVTFQDMPFALAENSVVLSSVRVLQGAWYISSLGWMELRSPSSEGGHNHLRMFRMFCRRIDGFTRIVWKRVRSTAILHPLGLRVQKSSLRSTAFFGCWLDASAVRFQKNTPVERRSVHSKADMMQFIDWNNSGSSILCGSMWHR